MLVTGKFYGVVGGQWALHHGMDRAEVVEYLQARGEAEDQAKAILKAGDYYRVETVRMAPNCGAIAEAEGLLYLNLWRPPTLVPRPVPFPKLTRLATFLTDDDPAALQWLWGVLAKKLRHPAGGPYGIGIGFLTNQGAGKETLISSFFAALGHDNCQILGGDAIAERFNDFYASKLSILVDEHDAERHSKAYSDSLKRLITSNSIAIEAKYQSKIIVPSNLLVFFASNRSSNPLPIEQGDRRFTLFSNMSKVTSEHASFLRGLYVNNKPTQELLDEQAGLAHFLQNYQYDNAVVSKPYHTAARSAVIKANQSVVEAFFAEVRTHGIEELLERYKASLAYTLKDDNFTQHIEVRRNNRILVSRELVYACFAWFARECEGHPSKYVPRVRTFFSAVAQKRDPSWPTKRATRNHRRSILFPRRKSAEDKAQPIPAAPISVTVN